MALVYTGDIRLSQGITLSGALPLDVRTVVDALSGLTEVKSYKGMVTYVVSEAQLYMRTGDTKDLASWTVVGKIPTAQEVKIVAASASYASGTSVESILSDMDSRLKEAEDGGITTITGDNVIAVSGTGNTRALNFNIATAVTGNLLTVTESGLTACLYYEVEDEDFLPKTEPAE